MRSLGSEGLMRGNGSSLGHVPRKVSTELPAVPRKRRDISGKHWKSCKD